MSLRILLHLGPMAALLALALGCAPGDGHLPSESDRKALHKLIEDAERVSALVADKTQLAQRPAGQILSADERALLMSLWAPHLDHDRALASYHWRFLNGWQNAGTTTEDSTRALAVGLGALAAQVASNLTFLQTYGNDEAVRKAMNEATPELGVSAGEYDRILRETARPHTMLTLQLATSALQRRLDKLSSANASDAQFLALAQKSLSVADKVQAVYDKAIPRLLAGAISTVTAQQLDAISRAVIEHIAEWLGDTRLRGKTRSLISAAQIDWLQTQLDPGDILLERRNWYLSNLGLPGFWPHAELYVGTHEELAAAFDQDPDVLAHYGAGGLTAHLQATWPERWAQYVASAKDGRPHRIIEAVSEGVVFSSLHEAAQADYLGAMRPRLTQLDKAQAVAAAFAQLGKPYDFDFDFLTQSELVCSELVYVAYQRSAGQGAGLSLPLTEVMGRVTLPPNDIAALFDQQASQTKQQLDFVAFLDGRESSGTAVQASEADLRASWRRPKWDLSQR